MRHIVALLVAEILATVGCIPSYSLSGQIAAVRAFEFNYFVGLYEDHKRTGAFNVSDNRFLIHEAHHRGVDNFLSRVLCVDLGILRRGIRRSWIRSHLFCRVDITWIACKLPMVWSV
jgi:hypothetical protein